MFSKFSLPLFFLFFCLFLSLELSDKKDYALNSADSMSLVCLTLRWGRFDSDWDLSNTKEVVKKAVINFTFVVLVEST